MADKHKKEKNEKNVKEKKEDIKKEVKEIKEELEKVEKKIEEEIEKESDKITSNLWSLGILFLVIGFIIGLVVGKVLINDKDFEKKFSEEEVKKVAEASFKKAIYEAAKASGVTVDVDVRAKKVIETDYFYNVTLEIEVKGMGLPGRVEEVQMFLTKDLEYFTLGISKTARSSDIQKLEKEISDMYEINNKTEKPKVVLAVMANCPFGNQAEALFKPIIEELGNYIEFEPRYIIYRGSNPRGSDVEYDGKKYWSLKGNYELELGMFELAVYKLYGPKTWIELVNRVNNECLTKYRGDEQIEELLNCAKNIAEQIGVNIGEVDNYLKENKAKMLEEQAQLTNDLGILGSPTIIINGENYQGMRDTGYIKKAVCSAFINPPAICETETTTTVIAQAPAGECGGQ